MISLRKVTSLKYIYINESQWLYTLQICTVWESRVEISHTLISFIQFFLCGQPYRFRDISQTSELKSTTDHFSPSTCFIHFHGLCNYLIRFRISQSPISLKITPASLIRNTLDIILTDLPQQDLTFSSNTF